MAPENKHNSNIQLSSMEIDKLEHAFKDPEFRKLLVEYSKEINDPVNRRRYEEEFKQLEAERSGAVCTFLHPQPGYVIKTWASVSNGNTEKVFINICSDENIAKPESKRASASGQGGKAGVEWSIPYSLTKSRRDVDKSGLSCLVYDVIFHPNAIALAEKNQAIRGLLNDTALEAVDKSGDQVKIDKKKVRFPKLKFKGAFHPTVIRKTPEKDNNINESSVSKTTAAPASSTPPVTTMTASTTQQLNSNNSSNSNNNSNSSLPLDVREPEYSVKYRHKADMDSAAVYQGGRQFIRDPIRPSEVIVEVFLPEMSSAKTVELDVEERRMTLESTEPAKYRLVVNFSYPVDEEKGSAKFDRSTQKLLITLPVKPDVDGVSVNRLTSTDSGIDIEFDDDESASALIDVVKEDTAYRTSESCESDDVKPDVTSSGDKSKPEMDREDEPTLVFPTYTCNVYDELMVLKLDVKNVEEESLVKRRIDRNDGAGFSLRFTTVGSGMVPMKYGFDMIFLFGRGDDTTAAALSDYSLDDLEVEIWDNNIIVQMALPMVDCASYMVGNCASNMKEHTLPQIRAFKQKRKQLMRSVSVPAERICLSTVSTAEDLDNEFSKERHSSGESEDSALSMSPPKSSKKDNDHEANKMVDIVDEKSSTEPKSTEMLMTAASESMPTRGILKTSNARLMRGRCFSESQTETLRLMTSASFSSCVSGDSSIPEEDELNDGNVGSICSKKSVRFSEVVHRQVFRSNSSILGQKQKNIKKAEQKKRRALGRRASEGDAGERFSSSNSPVERAVSWMNVSEGHNNSNANMDDTHNDSGLASSVEDFSMAQAKNMAKRKNNNGNAKGNKAQTPPTNPKAQAKKKLQSTGNNKAASPGFNSQQGQFIKEANSDLMFDLDF